jgi:hypothetical protein
MKLTFTTDGPITRTGLQGYSDIVEDGEEFFYVSNGHPDNPLNYSNKYKRIGLHRHSWSGVRQQWVNDATLFWPRKNIIRNSINVIEIL